MKARRYSRSRVRKQENIRQRNANIQKVRNNRAVKWSQILKDYLNSGYSLASLQRDWILNSIMKEMK